MEESNWYLKKEVNLTHLITSITMIVAALWWCSGMETRLSVLETKQIAQDNTNMRLEQYLIRIEERQVKQQEQIAYYLKYGNNHKIDQW